MALHSIKKIIRNMLINMRNHNVKVSLNSNVAETELCEFATIHGKTNLWRCRVGKYTYISHNTEINNTAIGNFCSIASGVRCGMGMHPSKRFISTHPIFYSKGRQAQACISDGEYFESYKEIKIGHDVWIGTNSIIIDGINIGTGAIVGAGAVVTKDVPPYAIVGGVPAKIIKYRFDEKQVEKLLKLKWWEKDIDWIKRNYKLMHDIENLELLEADTINKPL